MDVVNIEENLATPTINFPNNLNPCDRDTFNIPVNIYPANGNYAYNWSGVDVVGNATGLDVQVAASGLYFFEITNLDNGCSIRDSVEILDQDCPP